MVTEIVTGTTCLGKTDTFLTIKDPRTLNPICRMKNPQVPIQKRGRRFVDLEENILKNVMPDFGLYKNEYSDDTAGW
jgi:hypothetical protein